MWLHIMDLLNEFVPSKAGPRQVDYGGPKLKLLCVEAAEARYKRIKLRRNRLQETVRSFSNLFVGRAGADFVPAESEVVQDLRTPETFDNIQIAC